MALCKLCQKREANKAGTHVIPYFLLKSMLLPEGKTRKDSKEFGFEIGELDTNYFVGRNVSGEELRRLIGENYNPDELAEKNDPHTVDYEWCSECERLFGDVEDYYSKKSRFDEVEGQSSNSCDSSISTLFWCSIIWRIGATGYAGTEIIRQDDIDKLRELLSSLLPLIKAQIPSEIALLRQRVLESSFCYQLLVSPEGTDIGVVVIDPEAYSPIVAIMNKSVLLFYSKGRSALTEGVTGLFDSIGAISNCTINPHPDFPHETALGLSKSYSEFLGKEILRLKGETWGENTNWLTNQLFMKLFGQEAPPMLLAEIKKEVAFGSTHLSIPERYTYERISAIIAAYTKQFVDFVAGSSPR